MTTRKLKSPVIQQEDFTQSRAESKAAELEHVRTFSLSSTCQGGVAVGVCTFKKRSLH